MLSTDTYPLSSAMLDLAAELTLAGHCKRLVMTDDIKDLRKLREKAVEGKNEFYFGVALSDRLQGRVDALVRDNKPALLTVIQDGEEALEHHGISAVLDAEQDAYLITFVRNGMGFYLSPRVNRVRPGPRVTKPEVSEPVSKVAPMTMKDLMSKVTASKGNGTAKGVAKDIKKTAPTKRRKFTVIREITS